MDYYNCLRNQLNCEYAFCNQGICIKKMQEGYAQVEKTVKKEDLDIDRTPNNSLYFHLANAACTAAAASTPLFTPTRTPAAVMRQPAFPNP